MMRRMQVVRGAGRVPVGKRMCAVVAVAATLAVAFGGTSQAAIRTAADASVLGTKDPAKGTPVKIGFVTDGDSSTINAGIEAPVAEATTKWINQYGGGVGGHPIELDKCIDLGQPSKGTDCANQMIQDKVAAVVMGSNAVLENVWTPLHAAGIPVFLYGATNPAVVADTASTFVLTNGQATLLNLPAGVAKQTKAKKVTVVAVDVPAATAFYKGPGPALFKKQGLNLELVPIPLGTADMTPQMQRVTSGNPKGVVFIIGPDVFCIPALNGLKTAGFKGTITSIPQCLTDTTRSAIPAADLKGMRVGATSPLDTPKDPSMKQYAAVVDKFGAASVDKSQINGVAMFLALAGLNVATKGLKGDVTPASITAAAKAMPWSVLPGTGGLHFRCNGKADPTQPATCGNNLLAATIGASGKATSYTTVGDTQIPN